MSKYKISDLDRRFEVSIPKAHMTTAQGKFQVLDGVNQIFSDVFLCDVQFDLWLSPRLIIEETQALKEQIEAICEEIVPE